MSRRAADLLARLSLPTEIVEVEEKPTPPPPTHEEEVAARQRRVNEKWWRSISPEEQRAILDDQNTRDELVETGHLVRDDSVPGGYRLTPAGDLLLHQLRLKEWMVKHPISERRKKNPKPYEEEVT